MIGTIENDAQSLDEKWELQRKKMYRDENINDMEMKKEKLQNICDNVFLFYKCYPLNVFFIDFI